jgi:hypothetical protein
MLDGSSNDFELAFVGVVFVGGWDVDVFLPPVQFDEVGDTKSGEP